ncbi:hypothetical protein D7Z54_29860 [Salibacterium salarium]|uniref:Replication-relaxation n=1 Tax=Salibacterium salarium TaxID=284579 RepID=A0A428MU83_9BACI|nr:replication-relaxation family protein [Salibacterium salarium]RSL29690.1 hypothetical protein D7Z54_29860 [Salibacterium salarium]
MNLLALSIVWDVLIQSTTKQPLHFVMDKIKKALGAPGNQIGIPGAQSDMEEGLMLMRKTIDEENILFDIYRYRIMSPQQLRALYFRGRESYVYRKIQLMKTKGLIESKPVVRKGKKVEGVYYVTQKAIDYLAERGWISKTRRWDRNLPDWRRIEDILDENELYVQLHGCGAKVYEKREWKEKMGMHRTSYVTGGLSIFNKEYHVYMLNGKSSDKTIDRIQREIITERSLSRHIIFFKDLPAYQKYTSELNDEKGKIELLLLSYLYLPLRMGFLLTGAPIKKYLEYTYNITPSQVIYYDTQNQFADFEVEIQGERYFVADMLLNDFIKLQQIQRYPSDGYERHGKKILLLCWPEKVHEFEKYINTDIVKQETVTEENFSFHPFYQEYRSRVNNQSYRSPQRRSKGN